MSFCIGSFYFWQTVAILGFCHYLRRLGAKFPPQIAVDVGITTEQLLEEKEKSLTRAATKNDERDKQNALLRAKVDRLEKELDFTSKDRYELIRKTCILQNRLGDFQSWPQFREEYDLLMTEYGVMQRQRAREDISHEQMLRIAKEAKLELASANRAAAMSNIARSEELNLLKRERDDAREKYATLVTTTNTSTAAATKGNTPGDKILQEENTRLTLALRSQTSLLAKKTSEFERMQSLLKSRSNHSASQLSEAASTILSLEEEKKKGNKRIAKLEEDLTEAKEKAEQMEEMYLAVAFADMGEGEEEAKTDDEEEEEDESGEQPPTSWLLKQVVAISKKKGSKAGAPGADKSGSSEDDEGDADDEDDEDDEDDGDDEDGEDGENEEEEEEEEKRIHDENEDLFKDMMGSR